MDALSEALKAVRVTAAIFFRVECRAPWGFAVPTVREVAHILAPGTERLVNYHLVTDGKALVQMEGADDLWVGPGDILILPHGDPHVVSNGSPKTPVSSSGAIGTAFSGRPRTLQLGGGGEVTRIACGFFGCERYADRLFLAGLPSSLRISLRSDASGAWLENSIQQLAYEAEAGRPGADVLLARMAEALFIEALRRYMDQLPPEQTGWLAGARDPVVGGALALLHGRPSHPWTVDRLADAIGASRTVVAERFVRFIGEPPLSYLKRWRLQLAARLLQTSRKTVLAVASDVGYESEAAFNRAFKREFGLPPAQYRKMSTEARR